MKFFKKNKITLGNVLKFGGIAVVTIILVALISSLIKITFHGVSGGFTGKIVSSMSPFYGGHDDNYSIEPTYDGGVPSPHGILAKLSARNVSESMSIPPYYGGTSGSTAEDFEVTDYNATVETRKLKETCNSILSLKADSAVIFENTNESDRNCNFTFKVERSKVKNVLAIIEGLDPKSLSESTYTIKRQIDDFTGETDILEKKRSSVDSTLESALSAYEEITELSIKTKNAEALAKVIDSKIRIIDRLTSEQIAISEQLDRLARAKEDQLDRLKYTRFNISVYERIYFDSEQLADSWRQEVRNLVENVNLTIQLITVRLITFLLWLLPTILYILALVIIAKYGWRLVRIIWNK